MTRTRRLDALVRFAAADLDRVTTPAGRHRLEKDLRSLCAPDDVALMGATEGGTTRYMTNQEIRGLQEDVRELLAGLEIPSRRGAHRRTPRVGEIYFSGSRPSSASPSVFALGKSRDVLLLMAIFLVANGRLSPVGTCEHCGAPFVRHARKQRFCRSSHRVAAFLRKKRASSR